MNWARGMSTCPICNELVDADELAFNHHVNAHLDNSSKSAVKTSARSISEGPLALRAEWTLSTQDKEKVHACVDVDTLGEGCVVCDYPLAGLSTAQKRTHTEACLDEQSGNGTQSRDSHEFYGIAEGTMQSMAQADGDNWVEVNWDGPAKPGGWTDWVNKSVGRGDKWWDPIEGPISLDAIPSNVSPHAVHALLHLLKSHSNRHTRRAVVCSEAAHIRYSLQLDLGWGCGYRNALMCVTALLLARPQYRKSFSRDMNGADPGVRRVQGWIEEAWSNGFDREGSSHFKGKILGTRKWIGTSDLYAMFTSKGIPCELYDFPKQLPTTGKNYRPMSVVLKEWVQEYFTEEIPSSGNDRSALGLLMRTDQAGAGRGDPVRKIGKLPLILQHAGHSRTVVGYEETTKGTFNLLLFDPGRRLPNEVRQIGVDQLQKKRQDLPATSQSNRPQLAGQSSHESIPFTRPYTTGASEPTTVTEAGDIELLDDEIKNKGGWVKKKVEKVLKKAKGGVGSQRNMDVGDMLSYFRVSVDQLGKFKELQILAFTGGPLLSLEERNRRKVVDSTPVR